MFGRILFLKEKIREARNNYYNGQSTVSDKLYDAWVDELTELDPCSIELTSIGAAPISKWNKYTHKTIVGSLNKCNTGSEFTKWANSYAPSNEFFVTLKLDGLSVSLVYEDGKLITAATRGSGIIGEDVLNNVVRMLHVPLRLNGRLSATIRGEILLSKENHKKFFSEYSNCRNAASGISRRYDGIGCEHLTILAYQIVSDKDIKTEVEQFDLLNELGFATPDYCILYTIQDVISYKEKYQSNMRDSCPFELDGLVIRNNDLSEQESFGFINNRPRAVIAFKFDNEYKETTVVDILWQVGNSGRVTPVAVMEPVTIGGAIVTKASVHNIARIQELGLDIGAKILVTRANEVIPFVEEVVEGTGTIAQAPNICPECNSILIMNGENIQCTNMNCPAQVIGRLVNWIKTLNVLEWGNELLVKLVESGKVKTIADLYKLSESDLASIDRMGKRSAKKCYDMLWKSSEIPLDTFIGGLSIPMIGVSTVKLIIDAGCDTLEKFGQLKAEHFVMVDGIGPVKAKSLEDGLFANRVIINELIDNGVKIKDKVIGIFSGKKFAITENSLMKRSEIEKMIADNGGEYKSSVSKDVDYLISGNIGSISNKSVTAKKFGINIISEQQFLDMLVA